MTTNEHLMAWCEREARPGETDSLYARMVRFLNHHDEWERAGEHGWRWVYDWMVDWEAENRRLSLLTKGNDQ